MINESFFYRKDSNIGPHSGYKELIVSHEKRKSNLAIGLNEAYLGFLKFLAPKRAHHLLKKAHRGVKNSRLIGVP